MMMSNVAPATPMVIAAIATTIERVARVGDAEKGDGGHDQHADEPQPAAPLPVAADHRQPDVVDDRRPEKLEVVGEEGERKRGHRGLGDAVLGEARGERRADHREGEAGGDAQEQGGERRGLQVRPETLRQRLRSPLSQGVVIVDRERRVVREALRPCRSRALRRRGDAAASRSGNRCASRRSSPRPGRGCDHHVYCSGAADRGGERRPPTPARRTRASAMRAPPAGSRSSSGSTRQFLRSISLCAMFQSPHRTISRPSARKLLQVREEALHEAELGALAVRAAEPDGR